MGHFWDVGGVYKIKNSFIIVYVIAINTIKSSNIHVYFSK